MAHVVCSLKYSAVRKLRLQGTCLVYGFREMPKSDGHRNVDLEF